MYGSASDRKEKKYPGMAYSNEQLYMIQHPALIAHYQAAQSVIWFITRLKNVVK